MFLTFNVRKEGSKNGEFEVGADHVPARYGCLSSTYDSDSQPRRSYDFGLWEMRLFCGHRLPVKHRPIVNQRSS